MIGLANVLSLEPNVECLPEIYLCWPILLLTRIDHIRTLRHHTLHVEIAGVYRRLPNLKLLFCLTTCGHVSVLNRVRGGQRLIWSTSTDKRADLGVSMSCNRVHG